MIGIDNVSKLNINGAHDFVTTKGRDLQTKNPKGTCALHTLPRAPWGCARPMPT